jgi:hypothetical protein
MLNEQRVLSYVKDNLGWPFMHLELEDEKIMEYIKDHTLREFSYFSQDKNTISINLTLEANKVPGKSNEYYIEDPQGLEILNIVDFYTNASEYYLHGHPPLGPMSMGELADWGLAVSNAMTVKMFSSFDYTIEFKHPNKFRLSPEPTGSVGTIAVEYERQQPSDFSGIPNDIHLNFLKLALADIMIVIGRIRKRYGGGNLRTPFGEIPLESEILEEGKELKREQLEYLERLWVPSVRLEFG